MRQLFRCLTLVTLALGIFVPSACNKPVTPDDGNIDIIDLLGKEDKLYQDLTIQSQFKGQKMSFSVWLPNG